MCCLYLLEVSSDIVQLYLLGIVILLLIIGIYATIVNLDQINLPAIDLRDCD